ncbi:MAG: CheR family methyltransferase [Myxococcales bacterium]
MRHADIPEAAVARLAKLLLERIGLRPATEGQIGLRLALCARLETLGLQDPYAYVEWLEKGNEDELRALLPLVTVGKTDFFRDSNQFRALRARVFPELILRARQEMRPVRIWSAGCATGEEPYSLAMLAAELGVEPTGIDLLATDVNPVAVERARAGRFGARRFSTVPEHLVRRFFKADRDDFLARPELQAYVRFAVHNLAGNYYPWPRDGGLWDAILCRNVIIYFDRPTTGRAIGRFFDGLREGGYLCLGYSESLYRISGAFELVELESSFLYRKPAPRPPVMSEPRPNVEDTVARLRKAVEEHRKRAMTPPGPLPVVAAPKVAAAEKPAARAVPELDVANPLRQVARLLEGGEFEAALATLDKALAQFPGSLALLITRGNLLTVMGRQKEARQVYREALALEPLCAEAHLFLGIACYEAGGELDGEALQELSRAIFLDPSLGLAHYYAGRTAERLADFAAARRAYRNAVNVCQGRSSWTPLLGHFPDLPSDPGVVARAASYALAGLEEV